MASDKARLDEIEKTRLKAVAACKLCMKIRMTKTYKRELERSAIVLLIKLQILVGDILMNKVRE